MKVLLPLSDLFMSLLHVSVTAPPVARFPQDPQLHHWLTLQWLQPASAIRNELEQFATGVALSNLSLLEQRVLSGGICGLSACLQQAPKLIVQELSLSGTERPLPFFS